MAIGALHKRVLRLLGRAAEYPCTHCGGPAYDWATIHGKSGHDLQSDYMPLCRSCHVIYDVDARHNPESMAKWRAGVVKLSDAEAAGLYARNLAGEMQKSLAHEAGVHPSVLSRRFAELAARSGSPGRPVGPVA